MEIQSFPALKIAVSGSSAGLISHLLPLIIVDLVPQCSIAGTKVGTFTLLAGDIGSDVFDSRQQDAKSDV